MKEIIKQYIATFTVVIFMLISLTYCTPTADALDNNIKPANYTQLRLEAEQRQADNEVKQLADQYAKMSDKERMNGVVYE